MKDEDVENRLCKMNGSGIERRENEVKRKQERDILIRLDQRKHKHDKCRHSVRRENCRICRICGDKNIRYT